MAKIPLTLALSQIERGEGLGMRANHILIQQRRIKIVWLLERCNRFRTILTASTIAALIL